MRVSKMVPILVIGALGAVAWGVGCGGDETNTTPTAACAQTDPACQQSDCVALVDNSSQQKFGLRIAQLTITTPPVLATGLVAGVVAQGVTMNLKDCRLNGTGAFSWLFEIELDSTGQMGTARTGGAKPAMDPHDGYCFVNEMVNGIQIAPVVYPEPISLAGGMFSAELGMDLVVPVYLDATAVDVVLLPLKKARIHEAKVSADYNCIGSYNDEGLQAFNSCLPDEETPAFHNAARLDGFITLEDADTVTIDLLNQSLCVVLAGEGDGGMPIEKCKRDPNTMEILFKGDWCEATDAAADASCYDSVRLGAEFAASAVKINGDCAAP